MPKVKVVRRNATVVQHQAEVHREALRVLNEARKNLDAIERCVLETKKFPVYLPDLADHASALMCLAAQANALAKLERELIKS